MPTGRIVAAAIVFEMLTLVAAAAWWPIYESPAFVLLALVTVTVGIALGAAGARWSWPSHLVLLATLVAWLLLGVPLAVPAKALWGVLPTPAGLADLVVTTAAGWRQLLTIELPVGDYQALLVPVFVALLVASVLGVSVATRVSRPAFAVAIPALVLIGGIAFGGAVAFAPIAVGGLFAAVAVAWLVVSRIRVPGRAVAAAAGVVAAGLVVAVGVTVALPAPDRVVARDAVEQPFDARDYPSPLSGFRAYSKEPLADSVVLTVTGAASGSRIVLARMNDYDGVVYNVGGAEDSDALFSRVPERLGGSGTNAGFGGSPGGGSTSTAEIRVGDYDSVWVPTTGDPVAISFSGPGAEALQNSLYFSAALATVADTAGLREGDSYTLTTRDAPAATAASTSVDLAELTPGATPPAQSEAVPDAVAVRVAEWAPASGSPGERLSGIVEGLHTGYLSGSGDGEVFSRSGHGADRIQELLTVSPMLGDDEQYAVAGALLAEAAGFPARVAMGFTVPSDGDSGGGPGGPGAAGAPVDVRGRDASAWTEVYTAEEGWVPFDAAPEPRPIPEAERDDSSTAVQPPDVVPPAADDPDDPVEAAPLQQDDEPAPDDDVFAAVLRIALVAVLSLAVIAIVLAPFLIVLALKKKRRTRRRTQGSARARAAGGWAELVDAARDVAEAPPANATRREAARSLGGDSAVLLAERIDGAVYAPTDPPDREIEEIWEASDAERRRLLESRGWFARLSARVSTRSLRTYHGRGEKRRDIR
ncbi:transglutaminase-like domain-containing protein [Herbiconiux sp. CPCC 205763]|uniref:Transglutaminase-like domain-containing protein n=1 Tax=Herbiconiux aconitum TaxID=2970913 RepID=A0ABT2GUK5_9MICO|nr:transglutaminase-like domain-containing protein [Herbiconiux aconitum]MCS5719889.1 transglutaminase-like domain-containing protein [Herbiconiux aconitum]